MTPESTYTSASAPRHRDARIPRAGGAESDRVQRAPDHRSVQQHGSTPAKAANSTGNCAGTTPPT